MTIDNDTRGWILTAISGVACCVGASIICVDVFVRQFPNMRDFKIAESDAFLSASLSLSAGVILFSSLYSMLPEARNYLKDGGYTPQAASLFLIALFMAGVFGIRILSQIMHKYIPTHIVDCDHTHDEEVNKTHYETDETEENESNKGDGHAFDCTKLRDTDENPSVETTPLLPETSTPGQLLRTTTAPTGSVNRASQAKDHAAASDSTRPSSNFRRALSRTLTRYVTSKKNTCDENGPCMGFSDPCGQDCFKNVQRRGTLAHVHHLSKSQVWQRTPSDVRSDTPLLDENYSDSTIHAPSPLDLNLSQTLSARSGPRSLSKPYHYHHPGHESGRRRRHSSPHSSESLHIYPGETDHHHHVPTNAFLSIGLQTSIAIALHKAPEGFITFATNHANPRLGFTVFVALFIHNLTEGFALSLPLFLALNSRFKAILWASILGGLSQPCGAGIAALWFKLSSESGRLAPNEKIYGGIFAVTAGVMASVGLSLLSESFQLSHNKNTCIAFAFVGMGVLGLSMALTAK